MWAFKNRKLSFVRMMTVWKVKWVKWICTKRTARCVM